MSVNGDFERECYHIYVKLSEKVAEKRDEHYSVVAAWVKRKIMFLLLIQLFYVYEEAEQFGAIH